MTGALRVESPLLLRLLLEHFAILLSKAPFRPHALLEVVRERFHGNHEVSFHRPMLEQFRIVAGWIVLGRTTSTHSLKPFTTGTSSPSNWSAVVRSCV
jgi:hypothetical protein